jgi:hypothetical protein
MKLFRHIANGPKSRIRRRMAFGTAATVVSLTAVFATGVVAGSAVRPHTAAATAPGTYTSGKPANVNSKDQDTQTSLCVEPKSGAATPTNEPGSPTSPVVWPTTISPSGCKKGAPTNPYVDSNPPYGSASPSIAPAKWVGVSSSLSDAADWTCVASRGCNDKYIYDFEFTVPVCTVDTVNLSAYADDSVAWYLDGHLVVPNGGMPATVTGANQTTTPLVSTTTAGTGSHVIDFYVIDTVEGYTGLQYSLAITQAPASVSSKCGAIKICKVAGFGVTPTGTAKFKVAFSSGAATIPSLSVPVGPAPGGYCEIVPGGYAVGTTATITELPVSGEIVTSITNTEISSSVDTGSGVDELKVVPGWNVATYTDSSSHSGDLEICKVVSNAASGNGTVFTFTVGTTVITVPAGACSNVVQVASGNVRVTETGVSDYTWTGATTNPTANLIQFVSGQYAEVKIVAGGTEDDTVLTVTNTYGSSSH